jgi:ATP-binding cassette subfamily B protein
MTSAEDLSSVPLFGDLSDAQLSELATWFDIRKASEGVRLCGEGAPGYCFFVLSNGTAAVTCDGATVATLERGDFFGEIAILGAGRRTATVTTSSPATLLVMFGAEFRRLEAAHPEIASRIREAMEERLAARA